MSGDRTGPERLSSILQRARAMVDGEDSSKYGDPRVRSAALGRLTRRRTRAERDLDTFRRSMADDAARTADRDERLFSVLDIKPEDL